MNVIVIVSFCSIQPKANQFNKCVYSNRLHFSFNLNPIRLINLHGIMLQRIP
jgi:hypothetical protein